MKIIGIESFLKQFQLTRPYRIANKTFNTAENYIVKIKLSNGIQGLGAASPVDYVTKETFADCGRALSEDNISWLVDQTIDDLPKHLKHLETHFQTTPAARAAIDIALHDAYSQHSKRPLIEMLGRAHVSLPTSITIGIKNIEDSITEAKEYIGRGFKILKIKLGDNVENDIELLHALTRVLPQDIKIRVDMNQGYTLQTFSNFMQHTADLNIELIEQPLMVKDMHAIHSLSDPIKKIIAADESLLSPADAHHLLTPKPLCGIFNIKLMKCGGIAPGKQIAQLAQSTGTELMWGCMDESIISIAAALHLALASPNTRYLDLDGSLDLADDIVKGGFQLKEGQLYTLDRPGLGLQRI